MIRFLLYLGASVNLSAAALADDTSWLTRPDNPLLPGQSLHYTPVTAGVKRFRLVEPKNWLELNRAAGTPGDVQGGMKKGMDHGGGMPGMKMDGMDHGSMPGMKMDGKGLMR
jgi:hypothetical protein